MVERLLASASGVREFHEGALAMLERLGVEDPQVGVPGSIPTRPPPKPRVEVLEVTSGERAIPGPLGWLGEPPRVTTMEAILPCLGLAPCWLRPQCCTTTTTWIDPVIRAETFPVRIPEATVHLNPFDASVEGDVRTTMENHSEEGIKETTTECECRGGEEGTTREEVDGSADIRASGENRLWIDDLDELLDEVSEAFGWTEPESTASTEARFVKEGALTTIEAILKLLVSGSLDVVADIDHTVTWSWRGRRYEQDFHWRVRAVLPVDEVNYAW